MLVSILWWLFLLFLCVCKFAKLCFRKEQFQSINSINFNQLFPQLEHLIMALKKIKVLGPKIWNSLPPEVRVITSFGLFKVKRNRHMVQNYKSNI